MAPSKSLQGSLLITLWVLLLGGAVVIAHLANVYSKGTAYVLLVPIFAGAFLGQRALVLQTSRARKGLLPSRGLVPVGVALVLLVIPSVVSGASGWVSNAGFDPPMFGPGDEVRCDLEDTVTSADGDWGGHGSVELLDWKGEAEVGAFEVLTKRRGSSPSGPKAGERTRDLYMDFRIPDSHTLAGKTVKARFEFSLLYPEQTSASTYRTVSRKVSREAEITFSSPGVGGTYRFAWYATALLSILCAFAGSLWITLEIRRAEARG